MAAPEEVDEIKEKLSRLITSGKVSDIQIVVDSVLGRCEIKGCYSEGGKRYTIGDGSSAAEALDAALARIARIR